MPDADLLQRFRSACRYYHAHAWQKPFLNPRRCLVNQLRMKGWPSRQPGSLYTTSAFHLQDFTVVEGEMVSQGIDSYSVYEPELTEAFLRIVHPGQAVLDVGMHLGYYSTLFAILTGEGGAVHAFEPTPSTREIAQRNTGRFPQIQVHPLAVWSSARTIVLRDYGVKWMGWNTLVKAKLDEEPVQAKEIEVQTITLDQFRASWKDPRPISLIKIDAESAERAIIAGGADMIEKDLPLISVEVGDQSGSEESRLLVEDLINLDYLPWEYREHRFQRHHLQDTYTYDNLIFAPATVRLDVERR